MTTLGRSFGSIRVRTPLVQPGSRIGIMGGSFNPVHAGHVIVAQTALKRLGLDQLWWVVTPGNPLKPHGGLASLPDRMSACRRLARNPRMKITGFEFALGSPFTAVTLSFLKQRYRANQFVWVMGADNMASFDRWQNWRGIAGSMPIAVVDRPGWRHKALASPAAHALANARIAESSAKTLASHPAPAWVFLTTRLSKLSSTALRENEPGQPGATKSVTLQQHFASQRSLTS
ncbi:MAG: nicotinate-nucleotide adenylyltransferase [Hyphomicrobium sp.]